jgi:hypothetical protein
MPGPAPWEARQIFTKLLPILFLNKQILGVAVYAIGFLALDPKLLFARELEVAAGCHGHAATTGTARAAVTLEFVGAAAMTAVNRSPWIHWAMLT